MLVLLCKLLQSIVKAPGLNALDRILGMLLSLIKGVLVLYVIIFIVDVIPVNEGFVSIEREAISGSDRRVFTKSQLVLDGNDLDCREIRTCSYREIT